MNWHGKSPKPDNYGQMVNSFRSIVRDLKAQGITDPSNEDVLKENARRARAADAERRRTA